MNRPSTSILVIRAILACAAKHELDLRPQLDALGVGPAHIADEAGLVAPGVEDQLWKRLAAEPAAAAIGLDAAVILARGAFRALEYCVRSSRTLRDALAQVGRFGRVLHGVGSFEFLESELRYQVQRTASRAQVEFDVAAIMVLTRKATKLQWAPVRVELAHPSDGMAHEQRASAVFDCPVGFGAKATRITFRPHDLELCMREADGVLSDLLRGYLEIELSRHTGPQDLRARLGGAIQTCLAQGNSALGDVASALGLSERTLQRELAEAGTSFRKELALCREELARDYLRSPGVSVPGVATALGYSDATAFYRAFRRWTDVSPGEYIRTPAAK